MGKHPTTSKSRYYTSSSLNIVNHNIWIRLLLFFSKTPFTRYNRLSNRLSNGFDNRFDNRVERTALFVQPVVNRVVQPVWQPAVYTIQPFAKPVVKRVWQPVECLYIRYKWFDNRLYRVNGAWHLLSKSFSIPPALAISYNWFAFTWSSFSAA